MSTKIHTSTDALGNPPGFYLTAGQDHDLDGADALIHHLIKADAVLADKAYDVDECMRYKLSQNGCEVIIPPKKNRINPAKYDKEVYKERHKIENFFAKLKQYRAIATRYDKTAQNFLGAIYMAAIMVWLN